MRVIIIAMMPLLLDTRFHGHRRASLSIKGGKECVVVELHSIDYGASNSSLLAMDSNIARTSQDCNLYVREEEGKG